MNLQKYIKNNLLELKVIPNSKVEKLVIEENREPSSSLHSSSSSLKLYLKAVPDKDKANKALIKFFKDHYHLQVQIKSGERSRNKVLVINSNN